MKTMFPSGYNRNSFLATDGFRSMMYGYTLLLSMNQRFLNKLNKKRHIKGQRAHFCPEEHTFFMIAYILRPCCFFEI